VEDSENSNAVVLDSMLHIVTKSGKYYCAEIDGEKVGLLQQKSEDTLWQNV
jgi:hypothetical protein